MTEWPQSLKLVLLLDELSLLYSVFREVKDNHEAYAIYSILAAGNFSVVRLNPTNRYLPPFNIASHVQNPNFTLDETRSLFRQFMEDTGINVEDDVIEDVWAGTGG